MTRSRALDRKVPASEIEPGAVIRCWITIEPRDFVGDKTSPTWERVKNGEPINRLAVVLKREPGRAIVAYLATFGASPSLNPELDPALWWPMRPAGKTEAFEPLPELITEDPRELDLQSTWVCLRTRHVAKPNARGQLVRWGARKCTEETVAMIDAQMWNRKPGSSKTTALKPT